jgi:hypothetical protein
MEYVVQQGDCLASIAAMNKRSWQTLWNHPDNAALKKKRQSPNVLYPGDVVNIPDIVVKTHACATGATHVFQTSSAKTLFRVRLLEDGRPRKNLKYELHVDQLTFTGTTDGDGMVEQRIPATASQAILVTVEDAISFDFGNLDPIEEDSGAKQRLRNLGFLHEAEASGSDDVLSDAVREFQQQWGLPVTGQVDATTRQKLLQAHGS